jgi:transcriptional regulator with XRE-family HTH domain
MLSAQMKHRIKRRIVDPEDVRYQQAMGAVFRRYREKKGYTQEELAEEAQLNRGHMFRIESGRVGVTVPTIRRLCRALGVSVGRFIINVEKTFKE